MILWGSVLYRHLWNSVTHLPSNQIKPRYDLFFNNTPLQSVKYLPFTGKAVQYLICV